MRRIVSRIIKAHPLLHEMALKAYMPLENQVGRIRRARQLTPEMETMRRTIAPRNRRLARGKGQKILFLSTRGFNFHMLVDGVLAHGLRLRGADIHFYTCGGGLSLCDLSFENLGVTPQHCDYCSDCSLKTISSFGFDKPHTLKGLLCESEIQAWADRAESIEDPATHTYKGYAVGEAASVSLRYIFRCSDLPKDPQMMPYWRRMVVSACMLVDAYERLLEREKFDRLFIFNGLGYPERIMVWMAQRMGIPYVTYEVGMQPGTLMIAPQDMASWMQVGEGWNYWAERPLTEVENVELDRFLAEREGGGGGAALYWPSIQSDPDRVREKLGIPEGARVVTCFTNVTWDLGIIDRHGPFNHILQWLRATIAYFAEHRPDDYLVIRVHPGEAWLWIPSTEKVKDELMKDDLPPNVRIVGPEESLSSYALAKISDFGVAYCSTIGLEMALKGRPVVITGKAHYDGRGFTYSARTLEEYYGYLRPGALPQNLSPEQHALARRWTYAIFYRHSVQFPWVTIPDPARPVVQLEDPRVFEPGKSAEFDLLCRGILEGCEVLALRAEADRAGMVDPAQARVPALAG